MKRTYECWYWTEMEGDNDDGIQWMLLSMIFLVKGQISYYLLAVWVGMSKSPKNIHMHSGSSLIIPCYGGD